ncbi:MAG: hypothetical protein M1354_04225 [Candidatus Marsarchaeota archaeon]|nr:hypothetical protein [Candidatus Marsarchaeota archaeon]
MYKSSPTRLAKGARSEYEGLLNHPDETVRANAESVLKRMLSQGSLDYDVNPLPLLRQA